VSKYKIDLVEDYQAWDAFVDHSPQGTLFSYSSYLSHAVPNWQLYWVKKGNQLKGGLSLVLGEVEGAAVLDDLVIHNGLLFAEDAEQKPTKARLGRFEISEFVIDWLGKKFTSVAFSLAPQVEDLRAFQWHNYHSEALRDKYLLDLRYTSYVDIGTLADKGDGFSSDLFRGLETLRQRNIREARKVGAYTVAEGDGKLFCEYYSVMMREQGEEQPAEKLLHLKKLIDALISEGRGVMLITKNHYDESIYATVFGWDSKRAYYLFGAPVPGTDERYKGTIAFWDAFCWLAERGIRIVDMEGVNSPRRGWFKLSFGGDLRPYYQVSKHG